MQFTATLFAAAAALASMVAANSVEFINQDGTKRNIYFTGQSNMPSLPSITLEGHATHTQQFPTGWIGNWYSVSEGQKNEAGMLGEVRFDGFAGSTYFDVSAIVNPHDVNGVKIIHPKQNANPISGCQSFPCSNAYNKPDDIATLSTDEKDLVCLLGNVGGKTKRAFSSRVNRAFVTS